MATSRLIVLVVVLLVLLISVVPLLRAAPSAHGARLRGAAAVVVVSVGVLWMLVNHPVEGPILFTVARTHGMTVADIPSVVLFVVAGVIALPSRWRASRWWVGRRAPAPAPAPAASSPAASRGVPAG